MGPATNTLWGVIRSFFWRATLFVLSLYLCGAIVAALSYGVRYLGGAEFRHNSLQFLAAAASGMFVFFLYVLGEELWKRRRKR